MISSVDLAHYGVSHAKDRVSVDCGTRSKAETVQLKQTLVLSLFYFITWTSKFFLHRAGNTTALYTNI